MERVTSSGLAIVRVAAKLGVHETILRRWMKQFSAPGKELAQRPVTQAQSLSPADLAGEHARLKRDLAGPCRARHPKKSRARLRGSQPMTFRFDDEHRDVWPVSVICRVLGISPSGYSAWRQRPESGRAAANRALLSDIRAVHAVSGGAYGAPRVHAHLRAHGQRVGRHRVARPMRRAGLRALAAMPRRVRTIDSRHDHPIAPNRLRLSVTATALNQVGLADLTHIHTGGGWLFLAALIDMQTRVRQAPWTGGGVVASRRLGGARHAAC